MIFFIIENDYELGYLIQSEIHFETDDRTWWLLKDEKERCLLHGTHQLYPYMKLVEPD